MAGTQKFFQTAEPKICRNVYNLYSTVLQMKAEKKTKPQARKDLVELDKWFQEELPKEIGTRKEKYITKDELEKLIKWKLSRGKFRPSMPGLVASNKPEDVLKASKESFKQLPDLRKAIQAMTVLRGVGPATASALLAAAAPSQAPFMADESVLGVPGITTLKYDLNCYMDFATAIKKCTNKLKKEDPDFGWTPHKVELTVWTHVVGCQLDPDLIQDTTSIEDSNGNSVSQTKTKPSAKRLSEPGSTPAGARKKRKSSL